VSEIPDCIIEGGEAGLAVVGVNKVIAKAGFPFLGHCLSGYFQRPGSKQAREKAEVLSVTALSARGTCQRERGLLLVVGRKRFQAQMSHFHPSHLVPPISNLISPFRRLFI
jgi:hypothetical protein